VKFSKVGKRPQMLHRKSGKKGGQKVSPKKEGRSPKKKRGAPQRTTKEGPKKSPRGPNVAPNRKGPGTNSRGGPNRVSRGNSGASLWGPQGLYTSAGKVAPLPPISALAKNGTVKTLALGLNPKPLLKWGKGRKPPVPFQPFEGQ